MALSATAVSANTEHEENSPVKHVLLISVDGLHQNDLDWYVTNNPNSAMAAMVTHGTSYNNARTPFPSDSFPGMVGQTTGATQKLLASIMMTLTAVACFLLEHQRQIARVS